MDSIAGSVYAVHQVYLAKSLLHEWSEVSWGDRCGMFEGGYKDFTQETLNRILTKTSQGDTYFNPLCRQPGKEYQSENVCAYNVVDAMVETNKFMK